MSKVSINPEIDASQSDVPVHRIHGNEVSYRTYTASSYSSNAATWNITPPSMDTYMSRCVQVTWPVRIVYASATGGSDLIPEPNYDALRNLAGMRIVLNQNILLNGQSLPSQQVYDCLPDIIAHFKRDYRRLHPLGAIDTTQWLFDSVGTTAGPLGDYGDSETYEGAMKRGAYPYKTIVRSSSAATLDVDIIDWIYVPELMGKDQQNELGFIRVHNFDVQATLDLNGKNLVSHAIGASQEIPNEPTCTMLSAPSLLMKFTAIERSLLPVGPVSYDHLRFEKFTTAGGAVAINASTVINGNNIQLTSIPRFIFLYVREADQYKHHYDSDTFATITNVSMNFNNRTGLLASASAYDLWNMSKECGLIDSYPQFTGLSQNGYTQIGTIGSMVCLAMGKHVSLGSGFEVGQSGAYNFNVQVTCKNTNQNATYGPLENATLYVVVAYDQTLVIDEGGMVTFTTPLARPVTGDMEMVPYSGSFDSGVSFGGSVGDFFKKIWKFIKDHKVISNVANALSGPLSMIPGVGALLGPGASTIGNIADKLGAGGQVIGKAELRKAIQNL